MNERYDIDDDRERYNDEQWIDYDDRPTCDWCGEHHDKEDLYEGLYDKFCMDCMEEYSHDYDLLKEATSDMTTSVELPTLIVEALFEDTKLKSKIINILFNYIEKNKLDCWRFIYKHPIDFAMTLEDALFVQKDFSTYLKGMTKQ